MELVWDYFIKPTNLYSSHKSDLGGGLSKGTFGQQNPALVLRPLQVNFLFPISLIQKMHAGG